MEKGEQEHRRCSTILWEQYSRSMKEESARDIIEDIEKGYFQVYVQPQKNLRTNEVRRGEALIRYEDESIRLMPNQFIGCLEEQGLIYLIDLYVYDNACRMLNSWNKEAEWSISVNFSRTTLIREGLIEILDRIRGYYGVEAKNLEIEVTESVGGIEEEKLKVIGNKIKEYGFQLSLDDFGTRYSNLSLLSRLPFQKLKLDMGMIRQITKNEKMKVIDASVIDCCHNLGINVIAEGVETQEQVRVLKQIECDYMQGFLLDRALDEKAFCNKYIKR